MLTSGNLVLAGGQEEAVRTLAVPSLTI